MSNETEFRERVYDNLYANLGALRRLQIRTRRRISADLLGNYQSAFRGSGLEFEELREYEPGDEIRHIYWNASARAGKLFVKSYREERSLRVLVAVDTSRSMREDPRHDFARFKGRFTRVVEFCALLSMLAAQGGDALGLCTFGEKVETFLPPRRAPYQMSKVIGELCAITKFSETTDLQGSLQYLIRHQKKPAVIFLVSDFHCELPEFELRALGARHQIILVRPQDLYEREFPDLGLLEVADQETGEILSLDTSSIKFREWWKKESTIREQTLEVRARSCGAEYAPLSDEPMRTLQLLFERRAARSWSASRGTAQGAAAS